ncbi:MAG: hypothetical protein IPM82_05955 [Saprospiraceae bacterium]|nr:hypothetical protein [Saprospiraceae bacterium]
MQKRWTKRRCSKLYPTKAFDDKWMRNLMAAMCRQVEQFLVHQRLESDDTLSAQLLAKEYLERHEGEWHEKLVNEIINNLEAKKAKETEDFLILGQLHGELYERPQSTKLKSSQALLLAADRYLDCFYGLHKWRCITELNERQLILPEGTPPTWNISQLEHLTQHLDIPALRIYKERLGLAQSLSMEGYLHLKSEVFSKFEYLSEKDKRILLFYLINTVIQLWLKGFVQIMGELLELYKTGLKEGLLVHYGRLLESMFSNIVTTGNSLRQFDFTKSFINEYADKLAPEMHEDGRVWAIANTFFKQHDFEKSITLLSTHSFTTHHFSLHGKSLLLQAYFEACKNDDSYFLFMLDFGEAFKKYIHRDQLLSTRRKTASLNFVKYTTILLKKMVEKKWDEIWLENFEEQINQEEFMQGKQWILEKLGEIKDGLPS